MEYYYEVHFKPVSGVILKNLNFGKRVKTIRFAPSGTSYILEDSESNIIAIIPIDGVLYIQKIKEEE